MRSWTWALIGPQLAGVLPMPAVDPHAHAVQLLRDAKTLAPVEAAVGDAVIDPVLEELDTLARAGRGAAPEGIA